MSKREQLSGEGKPLRVRVTPKHIATGVPCVATRCMIVRAVEEALPTARHVKVGDGYVRLTDARQPTQRLEYRLDRSTCQAVVAFDKQMKPKPFAFTVRHPSIRPATWRAQRPKGRSRKGVKYNKTGKKRPDFPKKNRISGLTIASAEA